MIGQTLVQLPEVDIFQFPEKISYPLQPGMQLSLGDLHANAMKFIYQLALHGVMLISAPQFKKLKNIYESTALNKILLQDFNAIIDGATIHNHALVRLIGDELADRGQNDYFILKLIQKLSRAGVKLEILLSNHGFEFIKAYEYEKRFDHSMLNRSQHSPSMMNLQGLIDNGFITQTEVDQIIVDCYQPALQLLSYSLNPHQNEITLYSHAGIGLDTIACIAKNFTIEYQDGTAVALAQTIEAINQIFMDYVNLRQVHTLCDFHWMHEGYCGQPIDPEKAPVPFVVWNRQYSLYRPHEHYGYKINYVHGHDMHDITNHYIFNLDNMLGHDLKESVGIYEVLVSSDLALTDLFSDSTVQQKVGNISSSSS